MSIVGTILRPLRHRPTFALTVIASLAIGIGANTTMWSVVDALLLRPLPYTEPARLVSLWHGAGVANQEIAALREQSRTLDKAEVFSPGWLMTLTGEATPRQLDAARVSGGFFPMLGVRAALGHTFAEDAEHPGSDKVAVLSHALWRDAFGSDAKVIGRSISLDGSSYEVIGVMPAGFTMLSAASDLWTPMTFDPKEMAWTGATSVAYGRLKPGVTVAAADAELRTFVEPFRKQFGYAEGWMKNAQVMGMQESLVGSVRTIVLVLFAAVAFLLLIAIANVANLFLVRTAERRQELAVRSSLGATSGQLVRLLLGEAVALGVIGGALGIASAYGATALLRRLLPHDLPRLEEISIDWRVLLMATVLTIVAAVTAGLLPSLQGSGSRMASRIRAGRSVTSAGAHTRGILLATEVALALVLSVGALVMGRTLVAIHAVDPGLRTDHLLTMRMQPPPLGSPDALRSYWREVIATVNATPGVIASGTILHLPTIGRNWQANLDVEGREAEPGRQKLRAGWQAVSAGFFAAAGMSPVAGRAFNETDVSTSEQVMILNTVLAEKLFPGESPIGMRVRAGNATANQWATVVGVVPSVRHDSLNGPPAPELYLPFEQRTIGATSLVVRTTGEPTAIVPVLRNRIWTINRNVPISDVQTMDARYAASLQRQRMVLALFSAFAIVGLVLSAVGIYGVVAYGVRQRSRELGIRAALGATPGAIQALVVGEGLRYAVAGVAIGVPVALILSRFVRGMVYGVPAADGVSFAVAPLLLVALAVASSWVPARRAARADPREVLAG